MWQNASDAPESPYWQPLLEQAQTPFGATFYGGLAVAFVVWVVTSIIAKVKNIRFRSLWASIGRWLFDWTPVTRRRYSRDVTAALRQGVDEERARIENERRRVPQPSWSVRVSSFQDPPSLILYNSGYAVRDVSVTADPEYLLFNGEVFFPGAFGTDQSGGVTGKSLEASPTEKGREEGATIKVSWLDRNGDGHSRELKVPPSVFQEGRDLELGSKLEEGRRLGYEEATAQQEARAAEFSEEVRWNLIRLSGAAVAAALLPSGPESAFRLRNAASTTTARSVRIFAETQDFQFSEGGHWRAVAPKQSVDFKGIATNGASLRGIDFEVKWIDELNVEKSAVYHVDAWEFGVY